MSVSIKSTLSKRKLASLAFSLIQGLSTSRQTLLVPLFYQKAIPATLSLLFFRQTYVWRKAVKCFSILLQKETLRNGKAVFCQENCDKVKRAVTRQPLQGVKNQARVKANCACFAFYVQKLNAAPLLFLFREIWLRRISRCPFRAKPSF